MTAYIKKTLALAFAFGLLQEPTRSCIGYAEKDAQASSAPLQFQSQALAPASLSCFPKLRHILTRPVPDLFRLAQNPPPTDSFAFYGIKKPFDSGAIVRIKPRLNQKKDFQLFRLTGYRVKPGPTSMPLVEAILTPVLMKDTQLIDQKGPLRTVDVTDLKEVPVGQWQIAAQLTSSHKNKNEKPAVKRDRGLTGKTKINQDGMIDLWRRAKSEGYRFVMSMEGREQHWKLIDNQQKLVGLLKLDVSEDHKKIGAFVDQRFSSLNRSVLSALLLEIWLSVWETAAALQMEPPGIIVLGLSPLYHGWVKRWEETKFMENLSHTFDGKVRMWRGTMRWDWINKMGLESA